MLEKNSDLENSPENKSIDLPVHSMKSDLENFGQKPISTPEIINETTDQKNGQTSPFFMQEDWQKSAEQQKKESFPDEKTNGLSRSIIWGIIIFAVLTAIAGAYYFWNTRMKGSVDLPLDNPSSPQNAPETAETPFSADMPNYLIIADDTLPLGNFLIEQSRHVLNSGFTTPVEFILTDSSNNPFSFQNFADRLGILLPESIKNQLKPGFSLYLFNDQGKMRIGLALSENSEETSLLQPEILKEELNLARYFKPLLLENTEIPDNVTFNESNYSGNTIRFVNLAVNESLSVDYSFKNGQWLIGTSKATLRAMLDNIGKSYQPID